MRDCNPTNNPYLPGHDHLIEKSTEVKAGQEGDIGDSAQIIDFNDYLRNKDEISETDVEVEDSNQELNSVDLIVENIAEVGPVIQTLHEKRLQSLLAVAIGSVITLAIIPVTNNMHNPKLQEATNAGVISFVGWGVFYASIPYLQECKLGKYFTRKNKLT